MKLVSENDDKLGTYPTDSIVILSVLRERPRSTLAELVAAVQKKDAAVRSELEALVGHGLVESVGTGRLREYILSRELYARNAGKAAYTRQKGFSAIQHEQMILNYIDQHGQITRGEVMELCHLKKDQAYRLLSRMCIKTIQRKGMARRAVYVRRTEQ